MEAEHEKRLAFDNALQAVESGPTESIAVAPSPVAAMHVPVGGLEL